MALAPVSDAVGSAMMAALDANAAIAAESALLVEQAAVGEGLTMLATELAAEEAAIAGLEAAEAAELLSGPFGWIAAAFTGVALAGLALSVVLALSKQKQIYNEMSSIQTKIDKLKEQTTKRGPTADNTPLTPAVIGTAALIPDGNVVLFSELFDCEYNLPFSRCNRNKRTRYKNFQF
jgi:hypothetical protein